MVMLAQRLPIVNIPEQSPVSLVRDPMVNNLRRHQLTILLAHHAPRMLPQKREPGLAPTRVVPALRCSAPLALVLLIALRTLTLRPVPVAVAVLDKLRTAWIVTRTLWSGWHNYHPQPHCGRPEHRRRISPAPTLRRPHYGPPRPHSTDLTAGGRSTGKGGAARRCRGLSATVGVSGPHAHPALLFARSMIFRGGLRWEYSKSA